MTKLALIALLVALIAVSGHQGCLRDEVGWRECYTDADCLKVQITCCPCNMGGTERCVAKTLAPLYQEELKKCPPEPARLCIALENCKIRNCVCSKGRCIEKR